MSLPLLPFNEPSVEEKATIAGYCGYIPCEKEIKVPEKDSSIEHNNRIFDNELIPNYTGFISGLRDTYAHSYSASANECRKTVRNMASFDNCTRMSKRIDRTSVHEPSPQLLCTSQTDCKLKDKLSIPHYTGHIAKKNYMYGKSNRRIVEECAEQVEVLNKPIPDHTLDLEYEKESTSGIPPGYTGFIPLFHDCTGSTFGTATKKLCSKRAF
ncbi:hypothetical protein GEMRC1_003762 [Eukaryota sp. GEM-RC1]